MKVWNTIVKIFVTLAAIAGIVYVAATYGDKIVAWCKKLMNSLPCCKCCECADCDCEAEEEAPAEEEIAEEVVSAEADTVVAEEKDFEG